MRRFIFKYEKPSNHSILILPLFIFGQTEVILSVEQPAELGFKMSSQAATILNVQ